jgi:hypothetical protein
MTSSVNPSAEIVAIEARLDALTGITRQGFPQDFEFPRDGFGKKLAYRDFEPGSVIPAGTGRMLAAGEQGQPYVWAFQVHHVAPTRQEAVALSIETDMSLIGWEPSVAAGPIGTFYFSMYDEFAKNGESVQWIATRFYETTLGQNPDP